jgi:hypothetical protein
MGYGEVAWRFRLTNNGLLGSVVFGERGDCFARPSYHLANGINAPGESLFQCSNCPRGTRPLLRHSGP